MGLWLFIGGAYVAGGLLIHLGGLVLVVAASGGWTEFVEGFTNWLYFWRCRDALFACGREDDRHGGRASAETA